VAKKSPVVVKPMFPEKELEKERLKRQIEQLRRDVHNIINSDEKKTLREIVMVTAYVLDVLPVQVMSRNRKHRIVLAKAIVSVIASAMGYSASEIGRQMGYSDHTTVLHHIKNLSKHEPVKFWVRKVARMVHLDLEGKL
jgi:chromosomal replication initiation ATPase DnaA